MKLRTRHTYSRWHRMADYADRRPWLRRTVVERALIPERRLAAWLRAELTRDPDRVVCWVLFLALAIWIAWRQ